MATGNSETSLDNQDENNSVEVSGQETDSEPAPQNASTSKQSELSPRTFVFDVWAKDIGLKRKTTHILREQDLCSLELLSESTPQELVALGITWGQAKTIEKAATSVNSAHNVHTPQAQQPVQPSATPATVTQGQDQRNDESGTASQRPSASSSANPVTLKDLRNQNTQLLDAGRQFDELFSQDAPKPSDFPLQCKSPAQAELNTLHGFEQGETRANDPRAVLTMRAINKKVLHITQFLSEKAKKKLQKRRREVLLSTSDEVTGQDRLTIDELPLMSGEQQI